jgi:hypothetical protein
MKILCADSWLHCAAHIRSLIELLDTTVAERSTGVAHENSGEETQEEAAHITMSIYAIGNIYLGAAQARRPLEHVQQQAIADSRYRNFLPRLQKFLKEMLPSVVNISQHIHPQTMVCANPIIYNHNDSVAIQITEYRFLKSFYESKISWKTNVDYLRCSPKHFNCPRFDCILINAGDEVMFGQLIFIFTVSIEDTVYPITLIQPFRREYGVAAVKRKDHDLRFVRLRKQPPTSTEFIWTRSIIRGTSIFPAFDIDSDSLVFDLVDPDMCVRVQEMLDGTQSVW